MFKEGVVIPPSLRIRVLKQFHEQVDWKNSKGIRLLARHRQRHRRSSPRLSQMPIDRERSTTGWFLKVLIELTKDLNRLKAACFERLSTDSLNQTGNRIANPATTENTSEPQEFRNPNNNCALLGCIMKKRQKYTNTDKWRRQESQTIFSQVYSIHK